MHVRPQLGDGDEPKRFYSTLPGPFRGRERETTPNGRRKEEGSQGGGGVKHSLYQSPHLLLLQGYNRQVSAEVLWCCGQCWRDYFAKWNWLQLKGTLMKTGY